MLEIFDALSLYFVVELSFVPINIGLIASSLSYHTCPPCCRHYLLSSGLCMACMTLMFF
jgi:hypothetical protein